MNREEFIGAVVKHTKGGVVHCQADPDLGKVKLGPHNCISQIEDGDGIIIYYEKDHRRQEEVWFQLYRFCSNCEKARKLTLQARERGKEQTVVEGTLEHFEGIVEGKYYEDAVRLMDVKVLAYSPEHEGYYFPLRNQTSSVE